MSAAVVCEYADRREAVFAVKCGANFCPCTACAATRKAMS